MGINLNLACAFKPKRKPSKKDLDRLAEIGCYNDSGMLDDGSVYINASDVGGAGSDMLNDFIARYAKDYVVVEGDCDDGPFEEVVCPPHVEQWRAEIRWRQEQIRRLTQEIADIAAHNAKEKK